LAGLQSVGIDAEIYQIPETLDESVLKIIKAPPKPDFPIMTPEKMTEFDGFVFGLPTRFGNIPAQFSNFFDRTSSLWATGALHGKYASVFVTTASPNGGIENTIRTFVTYLTHQGMIFVPLGYKHAFSQLTNIEEVHSGAPWGAGAFANNDGSRMPSALEEEIAYIQGRSFGETVLRAHWLSISEENSSVSSGAITSNEKKTEVAPVRRSQASPPLNEKKQNKFCGICTIM
jgi:NAD(P)H:quinone oxidoreductase type IV